MKKYALVFLLFFTPISYSATETEKNLSNPLVPETPFKKLGNELKLNCKDVGSESCFSRFIGLSACTFMYGIAKNDKTVKESLDIADDLFLLLAKGNNLDPNDMFDEKDLIKQAIQHSIYRVKPSGKIYEGDYEVAMDEDELVKYLVDEDHQDDLIVLEKKLKSKKLAAV